MGFRNGCIYIDLDASKWRRFSQVLQLIGWRGGLWGKHCGVFDELVLALRYRLLDINLFTLKSSLISAVPYFNHDVGHLGIQAKDLPWLKECLGGGGVQNNIGYASAGCDVMPVQFEFPTASIPYCFCHRAVEK